MKMHNPPHPGEVIRSLCLEPLGLTVTGAAEALGVSRRTLSAIVNVSLSTPGAVGENTTLMVQAPAATVSVVPQVPPERE